MICSKIYHGKAVQTCVWRMTVQIRHLIDDFSDIGWFDLPLFDYLLNFLIVNASSLGILRWRVAVHIDIRLSIGVWTRFVWSEFDKLLLDVRMGVIQLNICSSSSTLSKQTFWNWEKWNNLTFFLVDLIHFCEDLPEGVKLFIGVHDIISENLVS